MASKVKKPVGSLVKNCIVRVGGYVTNIELYNTPLRAYDIIVGMDWLESIESV